MKGRNVHRSTEKSIDAELEDEAWTYLIATAAGMLGGEAHAAEQGQRQGLGGLPKCSGLAATSP
jgi:hypothetical protein